MTDAINIKDGYVINIGVKFNIITRRGYNKNDVLFRAIQQVKNFFATEKWQINQPIVLSDLAYQISLVDGVVSLVPPDVSSYKDSNSGVDYIHYFDSGIPGPHVMISSLVHGNEICGAIAVRNSKFWD